MEDLKLPLFLLCLCFPAIQTSDWTVNVPSSVKGLLGSCVVVPCSYNYPPPQNMPTKFTGLWISDSNQNIYHPDKSNMQQQYQSRTELGDVSHKNCSLKIDPLQETDNGPFHFRIEINGYDSFSYKNNKVSISVINKLDPIKFSLKEQIKAGQTVSASCSVSHSCPASPPAFNWTHSGEEHIQTKQLDNGQWEATSTLTFRSTHTDHNKQIQCTVTYKGGQQQKTSQVLQVKYAPVNVMVESKSEIKEGETVHMVCSGDANPPVRSYEWHNEIGAKVYTGNTYVVPNVSRHSWESVYCTAINGEGRKRSSPLQLNVLYTPTIKNMSACSLDGDTVKCLCIVESNPPSMVHFVHDDKVLSSKEEKHGLLTVGTLDTDIGSFKFVHCLANNTEGKANLMLHLPVNNKMQNIFIAAGAAAFLLLLLIIGGIFKKCRRRTETQPPQSNRNTREAAKAPTYATTKRKDKNEDVWCPDIYANDPVYGNIEDDEEDAIYANV